MTVREARRTPGTALGLLLLLLLCAAGAAVKAAALARFDALVLASEGDPARRLVFADLALGVLIEANETELAAASGRWQRGARDYVARLRALRSRLAAAGQVAVLREGQGAVRLIVDGEQVMLTAPRLGQQRALEARIVDLVCANLACPPLLPVPADTVASDGPDEPGASAAGLDAGFADALAGEWSIGDRAPPMYSQPDGLHCVFGDTRHLRLKQSACERVVRELRRLEAALRGVLQRGEHLDWAVLEVHPAGTAGGGRVSYAANGRYFELGLPTLASAPELVRSAVPWLQTRLRGQLVDLVIEAPERLVYRVPDAD